MFRLLTAAALAALGLLWAGAVLACTPLDNYRSIVHARNPAAAMTAMGPEQFARFIANLHLAAPWAQGHFEAATGAMVWAVPEGRSVLVTLVSEACVVIDDVFSPDELDLLMHRDAATPTHPPFKRGV